MSYQRKKRKPVAEINVVPYIDVMLVLLIIFMVTAPIIAQGVKVELPQAEADPLRRDGKPPIIATVDQDGAYFLNIGDGKNVPVDSLGSMAGLVASQLEKSPEAPVVVKGDRRVPYQAVIELMAALQGAGVPSVGLMTDDSGS